MAEITAQAVKALREKTGAGMMDCKKALGEADGEVDRAVEILRERGLAKAVKRAGRETGEGTVAIGLEGACAGLIELGCETDFVAKTDDFQSLATALATAVAKHPEAADPKGLEELVLDGQKVGERISEAVGKLGENIVVKRVERLVVDGDGQVGGYVHAGGKLGVVVGLATASSDPAVSALARDLAMHVAAADPSPVAVDRDGVPGDLVEKEAELFRRQAQQEGKPDKVIDKIVEGRIRKYYTEVCLLEQPFVKDPDKAVKDLVAEASEQLGGELGIAGFARFRLGETASS